MKYEAEFMQGILIASTALMGIVGIFLAQVRSAPKQQVSAVQRKLLSTSIMSGFVVIFLTFLWFMTANPYARYFAWLGFGFQSFIFVIVAIRTKLFL